MMQLVIYGTGLIAEVAHYYFVNDTEHRPVAYTNASDYITDTSFNGFPVVPFEDIENHFPPGEFQMFIAIGYTKRNSIRAQRYHEAKHKGYNLTSYISSKAMNFASNIGDNCFILENNVIQPFVTIGNNVTLWSGNHIGHHSVIQDGVFISSHVVVSGSVDIGAETFIGVNATIFDNLRIGRRCTIGAGAVVAKSVGDYSLVVPQKSRIIENRSDGNVELEEKGKNIRSG